MSFPPHQHQHQHQGGEGVRSEVSPSLGPTRVGTCGPLTVREVRSQSAADFWAHGDRLERARSELGTALTDESLWDVLASKTRVIVALEQDITSHLGEFWIKAGAGGGTLPSVDTSGTVIIQKESEPFYGDPDSLDTILIYPEADRLWREQAAFIKNNVKPGTIIAREAAETMLRHSELGGRYATAIAQRLESRPRRQSTRQMSRTTVAASAPAESSAGQSEVQGGESSSMSPLRKRMADLLQKLEKEERDKRYHLRLEQGARSDGECSEL